MTVTPASIKAKFLEFAELENAYIQLYIGTAYVSANSDKLGSAYDEAVSYYTAHLLTLSSQAQKVESDDTTSGVKEQEAGDMRRVYQENKAKLGSVSLSETSYGNIYLSLIKNHAFSMPLAVL